MADTKISAFTNGGLVQSGDAVAAARAGGNVRVQVPTQEALDAKAPINNPVLTGEIGNDADVNGFYITVDGQQALNVGPEGFGFRKPIVEVPRSISNGDSPVISILNLVVNGSRTDGTPLVLPSIGGASDGQRLTVVHSGSGVQPVSADAPGEIYDGSSGSVDSISLSVGEVVFFQALGSQWRVTSRYVLPNVVASLLLKQNLILSASAMAALVINAAPGAVNTKSVSVDSTFTQTGLEAGGGWVLILSNTDATNARTITLPNGGLVFFSEDLGAVRTTFTLPANSTVVIRFYAQTSTLILMDGETVLFANLASASSVDPAVDLLAVEQSGVLKKSTANGLNLRRLVDTAGVVTLEIIPDKVQIKNVATGAFESNSGVQFNYTTPTGSYIFATGAGTASISIIDGAVAVIVSAPRADKILTTQLDKVASTSFSLVSGFSFGIPVGSFDFEAVLHVNADAVGGHQYQMAAFGGLVASSIIFTVESLDMTTNGLVIAERVTALSSPVGQAGATVIRTTMRGTIVVSTAGTLRVNFAQNAASGTSSVLVGSTFRMRQLA